MASNIAISITADTADLQAKFAVAKATTQQFSAELNRLAKEAANGNSFDQLRDKMDAAAQQMLAAKEKANELRSEINQGKESFAGFAQAGNLAKEALGAFGIALSVGAVVSFGKGIFDAAAGLEHLAAQTGTSVEGFQALRNVMMDAGVSEDEATTSLARLNRAIGEAEAGNAPARLAFSQLGLTLASLSGGPEAVMPLVAQGLLNIGDSSQRAQIETVLFGRAGQELESALEALVDPTSTLIEKQQALGRIMGEDVAASAKKAEDSMRSSWQRIEADVAPIIGGLASGIAGLLDSMSRIPELGGLSEAHQLPGGAMFPGARSSGTGAPAAATGPIPTGVSITPENSGIVGASVPASIGGITPNVVAAAKEMYDSFAQFAADAQKVTDSYDQKRAESAGAIEDEIIDFYQKGAARQLEIEGQSFVDYQAMLAKYSTAGYGMIAVTPNPVADAARKIAEETKRAQVQAATESADQIAGIEDKLVSAMLAANQNVDQAWSNTFQRRSAMARSLENVWNSMVMSTISADLKWATQHILLNQLGLSSDIATAAEGLAAKAGAWIAGSAIMKSIFSEQVIADAKTAAANTYSAVSQIPVIGPALAPAAAGAAFAAVAAYDSFDVGTDYVPRDMPAMVHQGERIIPAADNRALIEALNGGTGGGSTVHFNYSPTVHANAPADFLNALEGHRRDIAKIFQGLVRDGYVKT